MLWREMVRYRVSSAQRVSPMSDSDALAGKDTVWPCVSLAISVASPELEFKAFIHLCDLTTMNSPDDLVDMYNLSTPPSTPSHVMGPWFPWNQ
ncbi:hypothetical protein TNCV_1708581 [Trichonephila clavipes]|nr:hypothetical protein TNCV_1708581 [Trichonephila clavipes]